MIDYTSEVNCDKLEGSEDTFQEHACQLKVRLAHKCMVEDVPQKVYRLCEKSES